MKSMLANGWLVLQYVYMILKQLLSKYIFVGDLFSTGRNLRRNEQLFFVKFCYSDN